MNILSSLSPRTILRQLRQDEDSSTFERLGSSQHVADLRLIFSATIMIMTVAALLALLFCFYHELVNTWQKNPPDHHFWRWVRVVLSAVADTGTFVGAVGAVGCGVLAWTYQTGSSRLGVVDLFACEIATLCRVAAVVDMVPRYIRLYETGPQAVQARDIDGDMPADSGRFTSQESYFPVFDSSVKDLQQLEAHVVDNVTAFYTYMKVMRDSLRKLADMNAAPGGRGNDEWHRAVCNVIYMQFLALESARKAIADLVEFEPTKAENTFTILLSELVAYAFLRQRFEGQLKQRLLEAREGQYRRDIPELYRRVTGGAGRQWDRARHIAADVMQQYAEIFSAVPPPVRAPELV